MNTREMFYMESIDLIGRLGTLMGRAWNIHRANGCLFMSLCQAGA